MTYPATAPDLELPELDGKTAKMYRGGKARALPRLPRASRASSGLPGGFLRLSRLHYPRLAVVVAFCAVRSLFSIALFDFRHRFA